jgi:glutamyl-tRNA reductase
MSADAAHLLVVGVSHRTAAVALREKASLDAAAERAVLQALARDPCVQEAVALSTCNRTELYASVRSPQEGLLALSAALVGATSIGFDELARARYVHADDVAVLHLLRVAASLDSMVLGESEIQGQVRLALSAAERVGTAGPVLRELFRRALVSGKRVRRLTGVGRGAVSIAQAAVELAARNVTDLGSRRALLVGAGRAGESTARSLVGRGLRELMVLNRSPEAAAQLARRFGGQAGPLSALPYELEAADIVICCTDSPTPLVSANAVARAIAGPREHPLVMIDIAVPRDVDGSARLLPGVVLLDVDDLTALVRENYGERMREAARAEHIVREEANRHLRRGGRPQGASARLAVERCAA